MDNQDLPKIKKIADVGEIPFQFVEKTESILQGWDKSINKTIYLFKTDTGAWGYFDKSSQQVVDVTQWKKKAAWVENHWVTMTLYHRVHLRFSQPVSYSDWDSVARKQYTAQTSEAIVTMTDTSYKSLLEQMKGRDTNAYYKFAFTSRKLKGRMVNYVDKVVWVG